jgi:vacuolar-type H+-ATPase subunit E/Vma4
MSQKELLEAIGQQVGPQTDRILSEAADRAAAIVRRTESELAALREGIIAKARHGVAAEQSRIVNEARLRAKREQVGARHEVVMKVMALLERGLSELPSRRDYPDILARLLEECFEGVTGKAAIRCRPGDRARVEAWLASHGRQASVEEADLPLGGVELRWGDRLQFVRKNSFRSRLDKVLPELLREAGERVLGQAAG